MTPTHANRIPRPAWSIARAVRTEGSMRGCNQAAGDHPTANRSAPEMPRADQPFDLSNSVTHLLHRAGQHAEARISAEMSAHGIALTARQTAVMLAVRTHSGGSQTELVATSGIDRSTLSEIMKRLSAAGLVRRQRVGRDRRAYAVELTADGNAALTAALPVLARIDRHILQALPQARRARLLDSLEQIARVPATPSPSRAPG